MAIMFDTPTIGLELFLKLKAISLAIDYVWLPPSLLLNLCSCAPLLLPAFACRHGTLHEHSLWTIYPRSWKDIWNPLN